MVELFATGGFGHRLQSDGAQVLPETEHIQKGELLRICFGFNFFSPWTHAVNNWLLLKSQQQQLYRKEAELLLTPTLLRSAQVFLCKLICFKREKDILFILSSLLKFPDTILQIAKTTGPVSSAEGLLSTVFESVTNATASTDSSLTRPGQYSAGIWAKCQIYNGAISGCDGAVQTDFFVSPCHQMHSDKPDNKTQRFRLLAKTVTIFVLLLVVVWCIGQSLKCLISLQDCMVNLLECSLVHNGRRWIIWIGGCMCVLFLLFLFIFTFLCNLSENPWNKNLWRWQVTVVPKDCT